MELGPKDMSPLERCPHFSGTCKQEVAARMRSRAPVMSSPSLVQCMEVDRTPTMKTAKQ